MEKKVTLSSVFPLRVQSTLQNLTVEQSAESAPLVVLNSDLDKQSAEELSQNTKLIVVGVTKALARLTPEQRADWATIDSSLRQNPLLEVSTDSELNFSTQLLKNYSSFSPINILKNPVIEKFAAMRPEISSLLKLAEKIFADEDEKEQEQEQEESPKEDDISKYKPGDENTVAPEEVQAWFAELVKNSSVVLDNLSPDFYTEIITWLSANFSKLLKKEPVPLVELIIVSYPSSTQEYFELTRVKITGWVQQTKELLFRKNKKIGITGDFTQKKFYPRLSILNSLKPETIHNATSEILTLID